MRSQMRTLHVIVISSLVPLLAFCGPTADEVASGREEREAARASQLAALADLHGATPVDFFEFVVPPFRRTFTARTFTAQLQDQIEGSVFAFRSGLVDIVRTSPNEYELVLEGPFPSIGRGTVVTLSLGREAATKLMADPPDRFTNLLVVAQMDEVVPITLEVESCDGADCTELSVASRFNVGHRISGRAIAVELER